MGARMTRAGQVRASSEAAVMAALGAAPMLSARQIAERASLELATVYFWLRALRASRQVEAMPHRMRPDATGLPATMFRLAAKRPRALSPARARLGDRVVTPSGRVAVVVDVSDPECAHLDYVGMLPGEPLTPGSVQLRWDLLVLWPKGASRPDPVRRGGVRRAARGGG